MSIHVWAPCSIEAIAHVSALLFEVIFVRCGFPVNNTHSPQSCNHTHINPRRSVAVAVAALV